MRPLNFRAPSFRFRFPSIAATPRSLLALVLSLSCVPWGVDLPAGATTLPASKEKKQKPDPALKGLPITELSPDEAILHALNRLAYGPRPGDVEHVLRTGTPEQVEAEVRRCLAAGGGQRHVVNLNHGVGKDTPVANFE